MRILPESPWWDCNGCINYLKKISSPFQGLAHPIWLKRHLPWAVTKSYRLAISKTSGTVAGAVLPRPSALTRGFSARPKYECQASNYNSSQRLELKEMQFSSLELRIKYERLLTLLGIKIIYLIICIIRWYSWGCSEPPGLDRCSKYEFISATFLQKTQKYHIFMTC